MSRNSTNMNGDAPALPALIPLGSHAGKPGIPLHRPVMVIGSRSNAHIHLLSRHVSKAHALLVISEGQVYIRDLASRERVFVNGQELPDGLLKDGDLVKIGSFAFKASIPRQGTITRPTSAPGGALRVEAEDKTISIDQRVVLIGRRSTSDITLVEESVSTGHAVIVEMNGKRYVRDLGSRTGTYVNGRAVHQEEIKFGDVLRIGETEMRYVAAVGKADLDEMEDLVGTAPLADHEYERPARIRPAEPTEEPADIVIPLGSMAKMTESAAEAAEAAEAPAMEAEQPGIATPAQEEHQEEILELEPLPLAGAEELMAEQTIAAPPIEAVGPEITGESPVPQPEPEPAIPTVEDIQRDVAGESPVPQAEEEPLPVEVQAVHTVDAVEPIPVADLDEAELSEATAEEAVQPEDTGATPVLQQEPEPAISVIEEIQPEKTGESLVPQPEPAAPAVEEIPVETASEPPAPQPEEEPEPVLEEPKATKSRAKAKKEPKPKKVRTPRRQKLAEEAEAQKAAESRSVTVSDIGAVIAAGSLAEAELAIPPIVPAEPAPDILDLSAEPLLSPDDFPAVPEEPSGLAADHAERVWTLDAELPPEEPIAAAEPPAPDPAIETPVMDEALAPEPPAAIEIDEDFVDIEPETEAQTAEPAIDLEQEAAAAEAQVQEAIKAAEPVETESLSDTHFARQVEDFTSGGDPVMEEEDVFEGEVVEPAQSATEAEAEIEPLVLDPEIDLAAAEIETPVVGPVPEIASLNLSATPALTDDQWGATVASPLEEDALLEADALPAGEALLEGSPGAPPADESPLEGEAPAEPPAQSPAPANDFFGSFGQDLSFLGGVPLALNEVPQPRHFGRVQVSFGDKQLRGQGTGANELPGGQKVLEEERQREAAQTDALQEQLDATIAEPLEGEPPAEPPPVQAPQDQAAPAEPTTTDEAPADFEIEPPLTGTANVPWPEPAPQTSRAPVLPPPPRYGSSGSPALPRLATFDRDPFESPRSAELDDEPFEEGQPDEQEISHPTGVFDGLAISLASNPDAFSQTGAVQDPLMGDKAASAGEEIVIPEMTPPTEPTADEQAFDRGLPDGFWGDDSTKKPATEAEQPSQNRGRAVVTVPVSVLPMQGGAGMPPTAGRPRGPVDHPRHRMAAKVQVLMVLMVLSCLAAGLAIYMMVPVTGSVSGKLRFANADKNPGDLVILEAEHHAILRDPEVQRTAREIANTDPRGAGAGFLAPEAAEIYGKMVQAAKWETAQGHRVLTLSLQSNDPRGDQTRMLGLLRAIHGANPNRARLTIRHGLEQEVGVLDWSVKELEKQIPQKIEKVTQLDTASRSRPTDQQIADLAKSAAEVAAAWTDARAAATQLQKQIEQIEATSPTTNPNDPSAGIDVARDAELARMTADLDDLNKRLDDARSRRGSQADEARQALDKLNLDFQKQMARLQTGIDASPALKEYVAAAQDLLAKTKLFTEELIQAQRNQHEKIAELKRRLDSKMAERRAELLAKDEELAKLKVDREMLKRRINAGEAGGKDAEAEVREAKKQLTALELQIHAREDEVGRDQLYTDTIKQLDEYIRHDAEQLDKYRTMKSDLLDTIQKVFEGSAPSVEKLPADQKKLAGDVKNLLAWMDQQRKDITSKLAGATNAANAAQKDIENRATALTSKIESRRADLLALRRRNIDDQQKQVLVQKREDLAALRQKESEAQAMWVKKSRELETERIKVARAQFAADELENEKRLLAQLQEQQSEKLKIQPGRRAALESVVYPLDPRDGDVHLTPDSDRRLLYMLTALTCIAAVFVGAMFVAARSHGGDPGGPHGPPEDEQAEAAAQENRPQPAHIL